MRAKLFRLNVPDDRLKALTRSLSPTHGLVEGAETAPAQGLGLGSDVLTSNGNGTKATATATANTSESSNVFQATTIASVDPSLSHLPPTETAAESVSETVVGNGIDHSGLSASASSSGTVGATSSSSGTVGATSCSSSGSSTGGGAEWVEVGIGPVRLLKPKHILSAHSHTFGVSDDVGTNMGGSFSGGGGGSGGGGDSSDTTHPPAPGTTPTSTSTTSSPNRVKRETCRLVMRREVSNAHVF